MSFCEIESLLEQVFIVKVLYFKIGPYYLRLPLKML
jgi:hypothetical protein